MYPILYAMIMGSNIIMGSNTCMHNKYEITRLILLSIKNIFILADRADISTATLHWCWSYLHERIKLSHSHICPIWADQR